MCIYDDSKQISSFARYKEDEEEILKLVGKLRTYLHEPYEDLIALIFDMDKFRPQWAILLAVVLTRVEFHDWGHIEICERK